MDLISDLAAHGVDQPMRDRLVALRDLYNDSKHKPEIPLLLARANSVVEQALLALKNIRALGIGVTDAPMGRELNYSLPTGIISSRFWKRIRDSIWARRTLNPRSG